MIEWLKDALGVNKYALVWDFIAGRGTHLKGRESPHTKRFAERLAAGMNRDYGAGTHWVERA
jgi:hypothetical protein